MRGRSRASVALVALVALHLLGGARAAATDFSVGGRMATGDNIRYREIARSPGTPYADHAVEFPPLTWAAIAVVAEHGDRQTTGRLLVLTQLAADLVVAAALAWGWGRRAATAWLALLVPLLWDGWIFARVDLLSVALAVSGLALVQRGREVGGGLALAAAVFAKVWPVVVLPWLVLRRSTTALASCAAAGVAGGVAWLAVGGIEGPSQVIGFRGARGWQIESLVGSLELVLTGRLPDAQANALRIGTMSSGARAVLTAALIAGVVASWLLAARGARRALPDAVELGAVGAVAAMLVLAPIISPQYLVWLAPFVALVSQRRGIVGAMAAAMATTALLAHDGIYRALADGHPGWEVVLLCRNALLVAVGALALRALWRAPQPEEAPAPAPASV